MHFFAISLIYDVYFGGWLTFWILLLLQQETVMKKNMIIVLVFMITVSVSHNISAEQTIQLSTINWEPYSGETLPHHGLFSEIVSEAFARVGYRVKYQYSPWARAILDAKNGRSDGVMSAYRTEAREEFFDYSEVVLKVKEEFISLEDYAINYNGTLSDLKDEYIGILRESLQAKEFQEAGLRTILLNDHAQNVGMFLKGRIRVMLIPHDIFFYQLKQLDPQFDQTKVHILSPPYKVYDTYVAFSKQRRNYAQLTTDFNRGLHLINVDGTYENILHKHQILFKP
jgi:polar amino acid transport system substrate-binding protein